MRNCNVASSELPSWEKIRVMLRTALIVADTKVSDVAQAMGVSEKEKMRATVYPLFEEDPSPLIRLFWKSIRGASGDETFDIKDFLISCQVLLPDLHNILSFMATEATKKYRGDKTKATQVSEQLLIELLNSKEYKALNRIRSLDIIADIQQATKEDYQEIIEILREVFPSEYLLTPQESHSLFNVFPAGCRVAKRGTDILGYWHYYHLKPGAVEHWLHIIQQGQSSGHINWHTLLKVEYFDPEGKSDALYIDPVAKKKDVGSSVTHILVDDIQMIAYLKKPMVIVAITVNRESERLLGGVVKRFQEICGVNIKLIKHQTGMHDTSSGTPFEICLYELCPQW